MAENNGVVQTGKAPVKKTEKKPRTGGKVGKFFREVRSEIKKVVWPNRQQVIKNTLIVIAMVLILGVVIWGVDALLTLLMNLLLNR